LHIVPQTTETFNVKLPKRIIAKIRRTARAQRRTQSAVVEIFILEGLARIERQQGENSRESLRPI
jgi:hypothetical protein